MNRSSDAPNKPVPVPAAEDSFGTDLLALSTALEKTSGESPGCTPVTAAASGSIFLYGVFREVDLEKVAAVSECAGVLHATLDSGVVLELTGDDARRFGSALARLAAAVRGEFSDLQSAHVPALSRREDVLRGRT